MFGLRWRSDATPRRKNGRPAHSTIGADRTSSTQVCVAGSSRPSRCPAIASAATTTVNGRVHQKRRLKSRSSPLSSSASAGNTGSRLIPHFGQLPGRSWRISGCIGQV